MFGNAPVSRREVLRRASTGFGLTSLAALMADRAYAGTADEALPGGTHFPPKVKNVIFCFMPGASRTSTLSIRSPN